jgi:hypothetical protein
MRARAAAGSSADVWTWVQSICVTKGAIGPGGTIDVPTFRGVALGTSGDAARIDFVYKGRSRGDRALASGQVRRQIGLKLRAADGCNLVYVMWRLDPRPQVEVSVKVNPGARTHAECGARGYTKLRPTSAPNPVVDQRYSMSAQIAGDELSAWIDDSLVWQGTLPYGARDMRGPSGLRSDNVAYSIVAFGAPTGAVPGETPKCVVDGED